MPRALGVWLDRASARIIEWTQAGEFTIHAIRSGVEPVRKTTGHVDNVPAGRINAGVAHGRAERRHDHQLERYYRTLAKAVAGADRLVVLGPGPAREEFAAVLRATPELARALRAVEPIDTHLTDAQVVHRARVLLST